MDIFSAPAYEVILAQHEDEAATRAVVRNTDTDEEPPPPYAYVDVLNNKYGAS